MKTSKSSFSRPKVPFLLFCQSSTFQAEEFRVKTTKKTMNAGASKACFESNISIIKCIACNIFIKHELNSAPLRGSGLRFQLIGAGSTPADCQCAFPKQTWIIHAFLSRSYSPTPRGYATRTQIKYLLLSWESANKFCSSVYLTYILPSKAITPHCRGDRSGNARVSGEGVSARPR